LEFHEAGDGTISGSTNK